MLPRIRAPGAGIGGVALQTFAHSFVELQQCSFALSDGMMLLGQLPKPSTHNS